MSIIINLLLFIVILGIIVFVHEGGHFIWAKITGVYVYEFAIGMGPKIWGFKKGETEYNLRAIPIGGFCQLAGEDLDEDELQDIPKDRLLQSKKPFERFLILVFGPMNNFILAVILIFLIALFCGGTTMNPLVSKVEKDSAAYKVGIEAGDKFLMINNHKVKTSDDISLYLPNTTPTSNGFVYSTEVLSAGDTVTVWPYHRFGENNSSSLTAADYGTTATIEKLIAVYRIEIETKKETYKITYYKNPAFLTHTVSEEKDLPTLDPQKIEVTKERVTIKYE